MILITYWNKHEDPTYREVTKNLKVAIKYLKERGYKKENKVYHKKLIVGNFSVERYAKLTEIFFIGEEIK